MSDTPPPSILSGDGGSLLTSMSVTFSAAVQSGTLALGQITGQMMDGTVWRSQAQSFTGGTTITVLAVGGGVYSGGPGTATYVQSPTPILGVVGGAVPAASFSVSEL